MIHKLIETLRLRIYWGIERRLPKRITYASPDDRRALLIVTGFPPDISGGAYRPASFARYAKDNGWDLTAVSFPTPPTPSEAGLVLSAYVGTSVEVIRPRYRTVDPSYRLLPRIDGSFAAMIDMTNAVRARFKENLPSTVVASGPSFCTFVTALLLVGQSSRRLILEYRDEWTLNPFDFVEKDGDNPFWERRCLMRADSIVVTTASHRARLEAAFGHLVVGKCVVVPNGWEPELKAESNAAPEIASGPLLKTKFLITFTGMLAEHTSPFSFLSTLAEVFKKRADLADIVQVRFVGKRREAVSKSIADFPYPQAIFLCDHVPLPTASRMMKESDAVLMLHNADWQSYLPGKLYEYAASGVPILLMDDIGESRQIVESLGLGHCIAGGDVDALETALDQLWQRRASNHEPGPAVRSAQAQQWLERHTRRNLAADFFKVLSEVKDQRS